VPYANYVRLLGHVGSPSEKYYTATGTPVYRFTLAVNRPRDRGTDWFYITVFDPNAKKTWLSEIQKGDLVEVEGRIQITQGDTRTFVDIIARRVIRFPRCKAKEEDVIVLEEDLENDEPLY